MANVASSVVKKELTLPLCMRECISEQQGCRPAGNILQPKFEDVDSIGPNSYMGSKADNLSPSEKKILNIRVKERMALQSKAPFPVFNAEQQRVRKWINTFCGDLHCFQLTPLRVLRIKILALLNNPELKKSIKRSELVMTTTESPSLRAPTDTREFLHGMKEKLIIGMSQLEDFLRLGDQERYNIAKQSISEAARLLGQLAEQVSVFVPISELLGQLSTCIQNQEEVFPLLLAPLGNYSSGAEELNSASLELTREAVTAFGFAAESFHERISETHREIFGLMGGSDIPNKKELRRLFSEVEACIKHLSEELKRMFFQFDRSPELQELIRYAREDQTATRDAAQVARIQKVTERSLEMIREHDKVFSATTQEFDKRAYEIEARFKALGAMAPAESPVNQINEKLPTYMLYNLFIRDHFHLVKCAAMLPFLRKAKEYDFLMQLHAGLTGLKLKPCSSYWISNADILFLSIHQLIAQLDHLSSDVEYQQKVYGLYHFSSGIRSSCEQAFADMQKKERAGLEEKAVDLLLKNYTICLGLLDKLDSSPICKDHPALKQLKAIFTAFRGFFDADENTSSHGGSMVHTLFLRTGDNLAFNKRILEFFNESLAVSRAFVVQFQDVLEDLDSRFGPFSSLWSKLRAKSFMNIIKEGLHLGRQIKDIVDKTAPFENETDVALYTANIVDWLGRWGSIDFMQFEELCQEIIGKIDDEEVKAAIEGFQTETADNLRFIVDSMKHLHGPMLALGQGMMLQDQRRQIPLPSRSMTIEEVLEESDDEEDVVVSDAVALPLPPAAKKETVTLRTLPALEASLQRTFLTLAKRGPHPDPNRAFFMNLALINMRAYFTVFREEFSDPKCDAAPFTHVQALYRNSALMIEGALKYLFALHFDGDVKAQKDLFASHDLSSIMGKVIHHCPLLEKAVDPHAMKLLADIENISISGRYLSKGHDQEATVLKELHRLALSEQDASPEERLQIQQLSQKVRQQVICGLELVDRLLSLGAKVESLALEAALPMPLFSAPKCHPELEKTRKDALDLIENIARLKRVVTTSHFTTKYSICFGNTAGNRVHDGIRRWQISNSLNNMPYYFSALTDLFPRAFNPHACYGKTNDLLLNATLLLEQTLISTIAYLDIPSSDGTPLHVLFETVNAATRPRPRGFDHHVGDLFAILQNFVAQTPYLPRFRFSDADERALSTLNKFIGTTSRYIAGANGPLTQDMQNLQQLSHLLYTVETWMTESEAREISARFGPNNALWKEKIVNEIFDIQQKIFPLVIHTLEITDRLMRFNADLRFPKHKGAAKNALPDFKSG